MKLNLGCGGQLLSGYCNVDKFGTPDLVCDLEKFPWPWADNSVDEILLYHVLEHLGQSPDVFLDVIKEMYRVCRNDAVIKIKVPHPRHDFYIMDPTHVRPITIDMMTMFSKQNNLAWQQTGQSNTPLAIYHNVDFEIIRQEYVIEEPYATQFRDGQISQQQLTHSISSLWNVVQEISMDLKVIK